MRIFIVVFLLLIVACSTDMVLVEEIAVEPASVPVVMKGVVDTMQAHCYDTTTAINCPDERFSGQDAQYQGLTAAYQDNGDGTVTDYNTGLMWQQNPGEKKTYPEAVAGAATFVLGGYDDWRLPTIKELYSLMDFRGVDPTTEDAVNARPFIDEKIFAFAYGGAGDRLIDSQWATSTIYVGTVMGGEECFFGVNFADGRIKCYPTSKGKGYFTLYVRGDEYGLNTFVDNRDETITDKRTGLTWMQKDSGHYGFAGERWQEALAFCEALSLSGKEWRLPNAKELQSIVDYSRSPSTTNSAAINPVFLVSSMTNEAGETDYPFYWTSTTHINENGGANAVYVAFGRAMGKMNGKWMDVHGAGAQRSDPKSGKVTDYPDGFGPQGDARRIENYIRCVSGGAEKVRGSPASTALVQTAKPAPLPEKEVKQPPLEAIAACQAKGEDMFCKFKGAVGEVTGECHKIEASMTCVPDGE